VSEINARSAPATRCVPHRPKSGIRQPIRVNLATILVIFDEEHDWT
jgi:hypothetical protein